MNRISRNISIILRSERLIAQRQLAILRRQTGLMAAAGIAAGVALIMLNVSAYLALAMHMSQPAAALIVALANLVLAAILVVSASKSSVQDETAPVVEVRDMALEDLEAEVRVALDEAKAATDAIKDLAKNPFGAVAPGMATTIAKAVVKSMKS